MTEQPISATGLFDVFKTPEDLIEYAHKQASNLKSTSFEAVAFYYFLARHLVVVYEVRFGKLPLQVWNEYRMAFDHFMRHLALIVGPSEPISTPSEEAGKIKNHLQRAVLDICKFIAYASDEDLQKQITKWGMNTLSSVMLSGSSLLAIIVEQKDSADKLFFDSKIHDIEVSSDDIPSDIIKKYLYAAYAYINTNNLFIDHHKSIERTYKASNILTNEKLKQWVTEND